MTLLLRRKHRTTVPWKRAAGTAANLAVLLALTTAPVVAQAPGRAGGQAQKPAAPPTPGSAGKVMYFHKPADALLPATGTGSAVAQASDTPRLGTGSPEILTAVSVRPMPAPVSMQPPEGGQKNPKDKDDKDKINDYLKQAVRLPQRDRVFIIQNDLDMEMAIMARLRADAIQAGLKIDEKTLKFPPLPDVSNGVAYKVKTDTYPPMRAVYNPLYVVHRRLHFEEKNAERYGWDMGIIQPVVSTLYFYKDVLLWPNSLASGCAYGFWDTNAGKCLPGSPTPYFLYPPGLTITGSAFEGVIITGAAFALP